MVPPLKNLNRLKARHGAAKTAAIVGLGIAAVIGAALAFTWVAGRNSNSPTAKLNLAMQMAQRGDLGSASKAIQGIQEESLTNKEDSSKFSLLKGAELYELSRSATLRQAQFNYLEQATTKLNQSATDVFPPASKV